MTPEGHRRLILTRHAKSDWDDPKLADHDRPLKGRGRRAARELGEWLASRGYLPDEVLSSDAARTRETWEQIAPALAPAPDPSWLPGLYHAGAAEMLACLKAARGQTVLMVGHNPGLAEFAATLPAKPPADPDFGRFPTAATLVVDFEIGGWAELEPGRGSVLDFFTPSERGG
jgi:phosphohistidine phosphatase